MREVLIGQGVRPELAAKIEAWLPEGLRYYLAHPQPGAQVQIGVNALAALVGQAMAAAVEDERAHVQAEAPPTMPPAVAQYGDPARLPAGHDPMLPASVYGSPLVNPSPLATLPAAPAPAPALPGVLPQNVIFGRVPRGQTPGPVPVAGPPPPNVQIGNNAFSSARVEITPAPGGIAGGDYHGQLQPGQTRVEVTLPGGEKMPPILKNPDGQVIGAVPAPLAPAGSPLINPPAAPPASAAAAPGSMASAFESTKIAGHLGPKQIRDMDAIEKDPEAEASSIALLLHLGLVELTEGRATLTQAGREARAIASNRLALRQETPADGPANPPA